MMTYKYDKEKAVIHLYASGVLVVSDPVKYFEQLDKDPTFVPKAEERVYFTNLQDIQFSYNGVKTIKEAFTKYGHGKKVSRVIFITDSDLSYGMARMVISIFGDTFPSAVIERVNR